MTVTNCVFIGSDRGIRLKSNRFRYSKYQDIRFDNIIMQDVMCPIVMNLYYTCGGTAENMEMIADPNYRDVLESTPAIKNIHISNVTARGHMAAAAVMVGLPEAPIENVTLDNVIIEGKLRDNPCTPAPCHKLPELFGDGLYGVHLKDLRIRNCDIDTPLGAPIQISQSEGITLDGVQLTTAGEADVPLVKLDTVRDVMLRPARPLSGERPAITQTDSEAVFLATDNFTPVTDG